jgi:hypothetical protein
MRILFALQDSDLQGSHRRRPVLDGVSVHPIQFIVICIYVDDYGVRYREEKVLCVLINIFAGIGYVSSLKLACMSFISSAVHGLCVQSPCWKNSFLTPHVCVPKDCTDGRFRFTLVLSSGREPRHKNKETIQLHFCSV